MSSFSYSPQLQAAEEPNHRKGRFPTRRIVLGASTLSILSILYVANPAMSGLFPRCPLHWLTGLFCPGCGSLRATHLLLHGNLVGAFGMNPLMVLSLPVLGLLVVRPRWSYAQWLPWAVLTVLIVYGIARNIPMWPLTLLAPY